MSENVFDIILLHPDHPCSECLVKVVCNKKCAGYYKFLERAFLIEFKTPLDIKK